VEASFKEFLTMMNVAPHKKATAAIASSARKW
jgi:hypothetical protein